MTASKNFSIQGQVSRGFEVVREAFAGNFVRRHELGGACSTYYRGEKVVDLWAVFGTRKQAKLGKRRRWWSSTRPRKAWLR
jgi:hypothetical protein